MNKALRHYEEATLIHATPEKVFSFADDHTNFSSHMNKSSWMMGGGSMNTYADEKKFREVGSHLKMKGNVFGINLFLDEVVAEHNPPSNKSWQTVGKLNLLVIGHYKLGFKIIPSDDNSRLKVYIDYELPGSIKTIWLGFLFGDMYSKWCVRQMIKGVKEKFK